MKSAVKKSILQLTLKKLLPLAAAATLLPAQAQLIDTWSYDANNNPGWGFNPATYGGNFRPATLTPDTGSTGGGSIAIAGMGLGGGGLGSTNSPNGYAGYYTFFNSNVQFTLSTTTILTNLGTFSVTFYIGGGNPTAISYTNSSLVLNYNLANTNVASSTFWAGTPLVTNTPIGPQTITPYTWTWNNLSVLGTSTNLSTSWDTQGNQHVFQSTVSTMQAVPEASTVWLIALGGGLLFILRRKIRRFAGTR